MEPVAQPKNKAPLLHLSWDSPDNPWCGGGGALRDWRILEGLRDWNRSVWTGRHPGGSLPPKDCRRTDLGWSWLGEFVSRRTWGFQAGRRLEAILRKAPATLISHSVSPWAPVRQGLDHLDKTLVVLHHIAGEELLHRLGPLGPAALRYENRILREGKFFSLSNRATASRVREANPTARIELIPIGFDPAPHAPPENRSGHAQTTISFLGRMDHRMKGLDRLFDAFGRLASRHDAVELVVAGRSDRSMESWISTALEGHPHRDRIRIVANPTDQEKYRILDESDIFCVPSRFEGWCIAAVEAQSRALPVVATRTDGLQDSVSEGNTGILVSNDESRAVEELAKALGDLVVDSARRLAMGEAARRWADRFTWASATLATDAFLSEIQRERGHSI